MAYDSEVLRRAAARLEEQNARRRREQDELRARAYRQLPRVAEIDRELRRTIVDIVAAALKNGSDPAPPLQAVRERNLALQREREELLAGAGFPPGALDERPLCAKCGDTGWTGSRMCDCLKQLCAQEQIAALSSLLDLGDQCFDNFSLEHYSTQPDPERGASPRENMELVYEVCLNYAQKFGRFYFDNLLLSGGTGLGKTFLSACIARVVAENGHSVVYDTAGRVFARFEAEKFSRDQEDSREARDETRRYLACDLLILDDLGSELTTPFVQSALYQLINSRLAAGRRTVISTNLTVEDIHRRYSPQTASRLEGEFHVLHFYGEDIRLLKKRKL